MPGYATVALDSNANAVAVWYAYNVDTTGTIFSDVNVAIIIFAHRWKLGVPQQVVSQAGHPQSLRLWYARVAFDAIGNAIALSGICRLMTAHLIFESAVLGLLEGDLDNSNRYRQLKSLCT